MGFIEKIKSSVEMWRIEKYTKRRPVTSPDFEQKGTLLPISIFYASNLYLIYRPRILSSIL